MSSLSFVQRTFDWGGEKCFWLEKKVHGLGDNCLSSKHLEKALIARQTLEYFSTLDLTQKFE